ncbi:hypothetical protein DB32_004193 [Sandaracinus amylolyticus]|uniref:Uncharacterized protein n=1 Tax=Sandaracinus amylolyticus TaxID=927083 RepID=A0A0F6SFJ3_9BACT|nr:hypothetical protein DB32_004193 [Sandaracinus amylolyticus]
MRAGLRALRPLDGIARDERDGGGEETTRRQRRPASRRARGGTARGVTLGRRRAVVGRRAHRRRERKPATPLRRAQTDGALGEIPGGPQSRARPLRRSTIGARDRRARSPIPESIRACVSLGDRFQNRFLGSRTPNDRFRSRSPASRTTNDRFRNRPPGSRAPKDRF